MTQLKLWFISGFNGEKGIIGISDLINLKFWNIITFFRNYSSYMQITNIHSFDSQFTCLYAFLQNGRALKRQNLWSYHKKNVDSYYRLGRVPASSLCRCKFESRKGKLFCRDENLTNHHWSLGSKYEAIPGTVGLIK